MTSQPDLPLIVRGQRSRKILRLPALEVRQGDGSTLYSFAVDGKQLPSFATISRIHRDDDSEIQGYQRPEVLSHINAIRRYIESDAPMIPNALVIAFDKRVRFEPLPGATATDIRAAWHTSIPGQRGRRRRGQARLDRRRPAAQCGHPGCARRQLPYLRHRIHHRIRRGAAFAVHLVNSAKPLPKG